MRLAASSITTQVHSTLKMLPTVLGSQPEVKQGYECLAK
jgi:hypothetical protein